MSEHLTIAVNHERRLFCPFVGPKEEVGAIVDASPCTILRGQPWEVVSSTPWRDVALTSLSGDSHGIVAEVAPGYTYWPTGP